MEDETAGSHREPMDYREGEKIFLVNLLGVSFWGGGSQRRLGIKPEL